LALIKAMNPDACSLKFRLPYTDGATVLPTGQLRLQCWCGVESTETRLVCESPYVYRSYDHRSHEQAMYHHNLVRPYAISGVRISHHLESSVAGVKGERYYDMYRETRIVDKYVISRRTTEAYTYSCIDDNLGTGSYSSLGTHESK